MEKYKRIVRFDDFLHKKAPQSSNDNGEGQLVQFESPHSSAKESSEEVEGKVYNFDLRQRFAKEFKQMKARIDADYSASELLISVIGNSMDNEAFINAQARLEEAEKLKIEADEIERLKSMGDVDEESLRIFFDHFDKAFKSGQRAA